MQGALIAVIALCAVLALNVRASMVIARDALCDDFAQSSRKVLSDAVDSD